MNKKSLVQTVILLTCATFLFLLLPAVPTVNAQTSPNQTSIPFQTAPPPGTDIGPAPTQGPEASEIQEVSLPNYALENPTQISVTYIYTSNYSISVDTMTQIMHQELTGPTGITFTTDDSGVFNLHVKVRYDVWVNQTVLITLFEKNESGKMIQVSMTSKGFDINMQISTSPSVSYPTTEDIVNAWWQRGLGMFTDFGNQFAQDRQAIMSTILTIAALAVIAFAVVFAMLVFVLRHERRIGKLEGAIRRGE